MYINKFDTNQQCAIQGQNAETTFKDILVSEGYTVREASRLEQFEHFDFVATKNNVTTKFEVKSRKRIKRGDDNCQDNLIYIEFMNVNGNNGWIYGNADVICFEREKDFVLVYRKDLVEMAEAKCNLQSKVTYPQLYKGYTRKGRQDLVSLVRIQDIIDISDRIVLK